MGSFYRTAADALLVLHFAYVAFVVIGFVAILVGLALRQGWARNPVFRWLHLVAILIVAAEAVLRITCPLTIWEQQLRRLSGGQVHDGDFIAVWLHQLMFFDFPEWVFTTVYVAFGLAVLLVFLRWPPRKGIRTSSRTSNPQQ